MTADRQNFELDRLRENETTEQEFGQILYGLAQKYASLLDLDFDSDVLPRLADNSFWQADYGQEVRDGKSIGMSTMDAFRCLIDVHRTYQIYQGIRETVKYLRENGKEEIIAMDAGTGTGILSLLLLSQGVDRVYAIEVNEQTAKTTTKFLKELGVDDRIKLIHGDATTLEIPELKDKKADILVSENLSSGLFDEPQYDIIRNLSRHLSPDAEIIPSGAVVFASLGLADWSSVDSERNNIAVRRIPCYQGSRMVAFANVDSTVGMEVPVIEAEIEIPTDFPGPVNALLISTGFQINRRGKPHYLEPDTAEFLGKTSAFRINGAIMTNNSVKVGLKYVTGRERKNLKVTSRQEDTSIKLEDTLLK